jgi:hypothetical protein
MYLPRLPAVAPVTKFNNEFVESLLMPAKLDTELVNADNLSPSPKISDRILEIKESFSPRLPRRLDKTPDEAASFSVLKSSDWALLFENPPITAGNNAEIAFETPDSLSPS